jgi:hypothetical protein
MQNSLTKTIGYFLCLAALTSAPATAATADNSWKFGAAIYGWFPDMSGRTQLRDGSDGSEFEIKIGDILDNLKFTVMGSFDARKGRWGVATDVIYLSVGKSDTLSAAGSIGGIEIPIDVSADLDFDMESWIWSAAGYYRAVDNQGTNLDLLAGFRYIDVDQQLDWSLSGNIGIIPPPGREGSGRAGLSNWDAIIGVKGKLAFGDGNAWFLPYYLDVGTGDSDFTWQAAAGVGYAFGWGEIAALWRHLAYEEPSNAVADLEFSGPAIGAFFRW